MGIYGGVERKFRGYTEDGVWEAGTIEGKI